MKLPIAARVDTTLCKTRFNLSNCDSSTSDAFASYRLHERRRKDRLEIVDRLPIIEGKLLLRDEL